MQARAIAVVILLVSVASLAHADQCQLVDADVAARAVAAIRASRGRVVSYCAPCGDALPALSAASIPRQLQSSGSSVVIDGVEIDLAYTYLEVAPGVFENIALRAGCVATGVPETLRFENGRVRPAPFGPVPPALRGLGWGQASARAPLPVPG